MARTEDGAVASAGAVSLHDTPASPVRIAPWTEAVMWGCMVSRNSPPSSHAPSNSAVKISPTAEGGV